MHEATIAQSILEILSEKLQQHHFSVQITKALIQVGEFRNVAAESLSFSFDALKKLYPGISDCLLECEIVPTQALCQKEKHIYHPCFENSFQCTQCGSGIGKILQGEELSIVSTTIVSKENQQYA